MLAHPQCELKITAGAPRVNLRVKSIRWAGRTKAEVCRILDDSANGVRHAAYHLFIFLELRLLGLSVGFSRRNRTLLTFALCVECCHFGFQPTETCQLCLLPMVFIEQLRKRFR